MVVPELNEEDASLLAIAMGLATGAASQQGDRSLVNRLVGLMNTLFANNANYTPYAEDHFGGEKKQ